MSRHTFGLNDRVISFLEDVTQWTRDFVDCGCHLPYGLQDASPVCTPLDPNIKLEPGEPETGNRSNNYASLIGLLMYAAVATRPDIAFAVNRLVSFTANHTMCHWTAAKHVLRYLKGTKNIGIIYSKDQSEKVNGQNHFTGYSDASFANNYDRSSVSGYVRATADDLVEI